MNDDLYHKIERIKSLLAQWDEIFEELGTLLSSSPTPSPASHKLKRRSSLRACSNCGKPGHQNRTCPDLADDFLGSNTLPDISTETQFKLAKEMQADGATSKETSKELECSIRSINTAFLSHSFAVYKEQMGTS